MSVELSYSLHNVLGLVRVSLMGIFKNSPSPLAVFFMSPKMNNEKTHPPESRPHPSNSSISFPTGFETHGRKRGKKRKKKKTKGYLGCSLPRAILVFFFF